MNGVQLCARFSIATNRLLYCGPSDAGGTLERAILDGTDLDVAERALRQFEALAPYLEAIAAKHDRKPFDHEVVEAYWLGNELLDGWRPEDFRRILEVLQKRGLPRRIADRLAAHLPENPIPHHMFHVSYVGVGAVTGKVQTTLENMDLCRPSWGRVVERDRRTIAVDRASLVLEGGRLALGPSSRQAYEVDDRFLPGLRLGDSVALHWGWPALRLDAKQLDRLQTYTERSLDASNRALKDLGVL